MTTIRHNMGSGKPSSMKVALVMLHHAGERIPALSISCLRAHAMAQPTLADRVQISVHNPSLADDPMVLLSMLEAERPRVLGLSCYEWNVDRSLELAGQIKALRPDLHIVLGGPQVSSNAAELLERHPAVDYIVCGEGEIALAELLHHLLTPRERGLPSGVAHRRAGTVRCLAEAPALEDLDTLPCVHSPSHMPEVTGVVYLETSRGCPCRCSFCSWGSESSAGRRRVRYRSLERIRADLDQLKRRGVSRLYFCDASLCLNKDRAKAILRMINDDDAFRAIALDVDAVHLDSELIQLMLPKLVELLIGVQTINPAALEACQRRWNRGAFEAVVRPLLQTRVPVSFQVMYGLPGDDHRRFLQTLEYLVALGPSKIQPFQLQILPGTHFRRHAEALGLRYDPRPPHYILRTPSYPYDELVRSRKVASLVHKLGCGFSWRCVPKILDTLGMSFGLFIEGLVTFVEQRSLLTEEELYSEVHLLAPSRELALFKSYLSHLWRSRGGSPLAYPRLLAALHYHQLRRRAANLADPTDTRG